MTERAAILRKPIEVSQLEKLDIPIGAATLRRHVYEVAIPRGDLRRGQIEALRQTVEFLEQGGRVAYIEQASGYGKSRWTTEVSQGYGGSQVFITPGETASDNMASKLNCSDIGRVDRYHKEFDKIKTVTTMQSLYVLSKRAKEGDSEAISRAKKIFSADLVFADEVHHFLTPKAQEILSTFLNFNPKSVMFGTTATEGYDSTKNAETQFGKCLHRVNLAEAVEEGVLISPRVRLVKTGVSLDGLQITTKGDFIFNNSIPIEKRDRKLLEAYLDSCNKEGKTLRTIAFLSNVQHAYNFAQQAKSLGIASEVVTGETKNRHEIYEKLRRRKLGTVATIATAIESLDLPWLEGTIHSAQTRSIRAARQMFPRSMRFIKGKKPPWIIQAVDEQTSFSKRPILACDILGVTQFKNGSVVIPNTSIEYQQSNMDVASNNANPSTAEEVNPDSEIIDINSLFKMGLLDKATLLGQNLLKDEDTKKFRAEIIDKLKRKGLKTSEVINSFRSLIQIIDDTTNEDISIARIVAALHAIPRVEQIKYHQFEAFSRFLKEGTFTQRDDSIHNSEINRLKNLKDLCSRYPKGELSEEETQFLKVFLKSVFDKLKNDGMNTNTYIIGHHLIDTDQYFGSLESVTKWMLGKKNSERIKAADIRLVVKFASVEA